MKVADGVASTFCSSCGRELQAWVTFCQSCGSNPTVLSGETDSAQPKAAPASLGAGYSTYDLVPWYRKNWGAILLFLLFPPILAGILLRGPVYYWQRGELKTYSKTARVILVTYGALFALCVAVNLSGCSPHSSPVGYWATPDHSGLGEVDQKSDSLALSIAVMTKSDGVMSLDGTLVKGAENVYQVTDTDNGCKAEVIQPSNDELIIQNDNNHCGTMTDDGHVNGTYRRLSKAESDVVAKEWMSGKNAVAPEPRKPPSDDGSKVAQQAADEAAAAARSTQIDSLSPLGKWATRDGNSTMHVIADPRQPSGLGIDVNSSFDANTGELAGSLTQNSPNSYQARSGEGCTLTIHQVSQYILVASDDNGQCDGNNVSLNGVYIQKGAPESASSQATQLSEEAAKPTGLASSSNGRSQPALTSTVPTWNDVVKKAQTAASTNLSAELGGASAKSVLNADEAAAKAAVAVASQCPNATPRCMNAIHVTSLVMGNSMSADGAIPNPKTQFERSDSMVYIKANIVADFPFGAPLYIQIWKSEINGWSCVGQENRALLDGSHPYYFKIPIKASGGSDKYRFTISMNGNQLVQQNFSIAAATPHDTKHYGMMLPSNPRPTQHYGIMTNGN